jgi:hypothetical protein
VSRVLVRVFRFVDRVAGPSSEVVVIAVDDVWAEDKVEEEGEATMVRWWTIVSKRADNALEMIGMCSRKASRSR